MALTFIDWAIVVAVFILLVASVMASRRQMRSVADFLAANRTAGRYLIAVSSGIAGLGAITIVANLEMNLIAGFSMTWWGMSMGIVVLVVTVSGWVVYRFRQTRCLTLAQFFEVRYSRNFRIFAGIISFISGLINFGIFPAVGARFFIYFCGLPPELPLFGLMVPTFPMIMIGLLSVALWFVFMGGQIAVIVSDFIQGAFVDIVMIAIVVYFFFTVDWSQIQAALNLVPDPENASLINPFKTSHIEDFNFWYFLIGVIGFMYRTLSWQGTQGYNASAKSAHEAKMGGVLSLWKVLPQSLMLAFVPIVAFTVLNHPDFSVFSASISDQLQGIPNEIVQRQQKVPLVLQQLLPVGMVGAFAAVMLAAFISTHDSYLHSWGSILIQDVIMPFRKKPFTKKQHLLLLRLSILFVAIFIFFFSLLYQQNEAILLFFAITGAIFAGGSGAVVIGGLYWKYGTTAAAWTALLTGSTIAVGGIILREIYPDFPINGQEFWGIGMGMSVILYIFVSLIGGKKAFDMSKLLHKGEKTVHGESTIVTEKPRRGWKMLGMGKEFTTGDKFIYIVNYIWTFSWVIVFIVGTIHNLHHEVSDATWMKFWRIHLVIHLCLAVITVTWFLIGGVRDLKFMFNRLNMMNRDDSDDGFVLKDDVKE